MDAKLPAEPLHAVNGPILKLQLRRLKARTQPPTDNIFELLQGDGASTALFVNEVLQLDGRHRLLGSLDRKQLAGTDAKNSTELPHLVRRVALRKLIIAILDVPD